MGVIGMIAAVGGVPMQRCSFGALDIIMILAVWVAVFAAVRVCIGGRFALVTTVAAALVASVVAFALYRVESAADGLISTYSNELLVEDTYTLAGIRPEKGGTLGTAANHTTKVSFMDASGDMRSGTFVVDGAGRGRLYEKGSTVEYDPFGGSADVDAAGSAPVDAKANRAAVGDGSGRAHARSNTKTNKDSAYGHDYDYASRPSNR